MIGEIGEHKKREPLQVLPVEVPLSFTSLRENRRYKNPLFYNVLQSIVNLFYSTFFDVFRRSRRGHG